MLVRLLLAAMFVMALAPRTRACPRGTACVSAETRGGGELAQPRRMLPTAVQLRLTEAHVTGDAPLGASLRTHVAPRRPALEMPWIWTQLRQHVYARLPSYERAAHRPENTFSLVLSPVVVSSPQDTVPGLGVEGGF